MITARWLRARTTLGWQLFKHVLLVPFVKKRGPEPWLGKLRTESIASTPAGAWKLFEPSSRCIGCGLCEAVAAPGEEPAAWIQGAARSPGDAPLALSEADKLERLAEAIARVCPTQVGVREIAALIEKNAAELRPRQERTRG